MEDQNDKNKTGGDKQTPPPPPVVINTEPETFTLPSGKKATIKPYQGKHIRQALKIADGDTSIIPFALISLIVTVEDKPVIYEDIDEMYGPDVMKLMEKFGDFT